MSIISTLTEADFIQAWQIESVTQRFPWTLSLFQTNYGDNYYNLKLHDGKQMKGFLISQYLADEGSLFNIAIHPDYQGQGQGKALLSYWIEQMASKNVSTLWLEVRCSNLTAIALYQQLGFNEVTLRKNYYPAEQGKEDALVMGLYL